jgi:hypothetical protein
MSGYWFALALCVLFLLILVQLLRRKSIREKYAVLWIVAALGVIVVGAFPGLSVVLARWVGVQMPVNLVFAVAIFFLLVVCIQLSIAVSNLEERTRTLTEEAALLRQELAASRPPDDPSQ